MLEVISAFWAKYGGILLTDGTRDTLVMVPPPCSPICWVCLLGRPRSHPSPTASGSLDPDRESDLGC